jgi:threonine/homoserine/homoserine lactone efflux protein
MMTIIALPVCAFVMGFVAAVPVGATQLEIARRSINGYLSSALVVVAGALVSDILYGTIALFGIASFLQDPKVVAVFEAVSAVVCVALGIWAIHEGRHSAGGDHPAGRLLQQHHTAVVTGFVLAVMNPLMIMWWLFGVRILKDFGVFPQYNTPNLVVYLVAGSLGIAAYSSLLALAVYRAKAFCTERTIRRVSIGCGVVLLGLAMYFAVRSAVVFMR